MNYSLESIGFELFPVETRDGTEVCRLQTPFLLGNQYPFDIYAEENNGQFHLFDEGFTLHSLLALGVSFDKAWQWKALNKIVTDHGVYFTKYCTIESFGPLSTAGQMTSDYISALMGIDRWANEALVIEPDKTDLVEASKDMFRRWKPQAKIIDKPKLSGLNGTTLSYDFAVDNCYIDALTPNAAACAAYTHKALSSRAAGLNPDIELWVVMDDRENKQKAQNEMNILTAVARAIPYSALVRNAANTTPIRHTA